jgi:Fe-S cluster assembly protein SufD
VVVGDGAQLTLVSVQEWDDDAHHLAQHDVVVGRDASVRHIAVTLGGGIVRMNTNATYAGPGGSFEGLGVYFADAGQHLEHRLFVDHDRRTAAATSSTRAPSRARVPTRCGSATC